MCVGILGLLNINILSNIFYMMIKSTVALGFCLYTYNLFIETNKTKSELDQFLLTLYISLCIIAFNLN